MQKTENQVALIVSHTPLPTFVFKCSRLPKEHQILRKSNLYTLTNDSAAAVKIRLREMRPLPGIRCMTSPVTVMLFTLGQFPVRTPEVYFFSFEEIRNGVSNCIEYEVGIDTRIWFLGHFFCGGKVEIGRFPKCCNNQRPVLVTCPRMQTILRKRRSAIKQFIDTFPPCPAHRSPKKNSFRVSARQVTPIGGSGVAKSHGFAPRRGDEIPEGR